MAPTLDLAIVQLRPRKGNYAANVARIGEVLARVDALDPRPAVVQFPETAVTGYFVEGAVRDLAVTAGTLARDIDAAYRRALPAARTLDVVIGFYEKWRDTLYNSAAYIRVGGDAASIVHVHRKNFLPTYGLFDEERFVERGHEMRAFDTPWGRAGRCTDHLSLVGGAGAWRVAARGRNPWPGFGCPLGASRPRYRRGTRRVRDVRQSRRQ
jgi:predicted amidohydrolase